MRKAKKINPEIRKFKLSDLNPAEYNPREITPDALKGLTASVETFGYVEPIIVNIRGGRNVIVGGHQRLKALKALDQKEAVCVTVDLSEKDERALNVTLNNPTIQGTFAKNLVEYLDKLHEQIGNAAFVNLRLEKLRLAIEAKKFEFRPGDPAPKVKAGTSKFFLAKGNLKKFDKYENFILDFSGGKDSTLALAWAKRHFGDRNIYAVFADPGVEFPGMSDHVYQVCQYFQVNCVIRKPETDWWVWMRQEGQWPSLIYRKCQQEFIFKTTKAFRKGFDKKNTLLLDGSRGTQAVRGSKKGLDTPVGSLPDYDAYHPCYPLTDEEAAKLLEEFKAPLWPGYKQGFVRTACWCCPGQCGLQALALVENYPGLAEHIRWWEKRLGKINPLRDVSFDDKVEAGRKQRRAEEKKKERAKKKTQRNKTAASGE